MSSTIVLRTTGTLYGMPNSKKRKFPRESLSRNLRFLLRERKWSESDLAKESGVAQKTINKILNENSAPNLDTLASVAGAFGLTYWHLIMPNLPDELRSDNTISKLLNFFIESDTEGRDLIAKFAERESGRKVEVKGNSKEIQQAVNPVTNRKERPGIDAMMVASPEETGKTKGRKKGK